MASLFPLIAQREKLYGECAAEVLLNVLKTKDEYMAFRKQIIEIFYSDVHRVYSTIIGLLCGQPAEPKKVEANFKQDA